MMTNSINNYTLSFLRPITCAWACSTRAAVLPWCMGSPPRCTTRACCCRCTGPHRTSPGTSTSYKQVGGCGERLVTCIIIIIYDVFFVVFRMWLFYFILFIYFFFCVCVCMYFLNIYFFSVYFFNIYFLQHLFL